MGIVPVLVVRDVVPDRSEMRGVTGVWTHLNRWHGLASLILFSGLMSILPAVLTAEPLYRALALLSLPACLMFVLLRSHGAEAWQQSVLQSPPYDPPPTWTVGSEGIHISNDRQSISLSWSAVLVIDEPDRIAFATAPNVLWVLPRRLLTTDQSKILEGIIADAAPRHAQSVDSPPLPSDNRLT